MSTYKDRANEATQGWNHRSIHEEEATRLRKEATLELPRLKYRNELEDKVYVRTPSYL